MNYSVQKELVLADLKARKDHPTAAEVYKSVKEVCPNISLATVYRNLQSLCKNGDIISFYSKGIEHFDGDNSAHVHFICNDCDTVFDAFIDFEKALKESVLSAIPDAEIEKVNIITFGTCKKCSKDKN